MSPNLLHLLQHQSAIKNTDFSPILFRLNNEFDLHALEVLISSNPHIIICDRIADQLTDLAKVENPSSKLSEEYIQEYTKQKTANSSLEEYGVWVYYPWRAMVVHILDEPEFIKIRTIRNAYKITFAEQEELKSKRIGIIGLSVGHSVALTIALERICGEIRLADFDSLELSNLNRIRTPLSNLGLKKTIATAREIAEIDPFLRITCFNEGIDDSNIHDFFNKDGKIDLLIEECDSVEIKILSRKIAKKNRVPVIMDTSDRGMLDIERYDLNPDYPILHNLLDEQISYDFLKSLKTSEEKLPYILPILGVNELSTALKASGLEVGKSITTWPQLGSDVTLGGALCANVSRRILLGQNINSGRSYIDLDILIPDISEKSNELIDVFEGEMNKEILPTIYSKLNLKEKKPLPEEVLQKIISDANKATSPGNSQRWLWYYKDGNLLLFNDKNKEIGFADNFSFGTLVGLGCAIENLRLSASAFNLTPTIKIINNSEAPNLVAIINFSNLLITSKVDQELREQIDSRCSNRNNAPYKPLSEIHANEILQVPLEDQVKLTLIQDRGKIDEIGRLICKGDRIRLTNVYGHQDFFKQELRWSKKESEDKKDGLDITLFNLSELDKIGLLLSKDIETIRLLNKFGGGKGFERISEKSLSEASAIGILSISNYSKEDLIKAGISTEKIWLKSTSFNLGFQPYTVLQMLFSRLHLDEFSYLTSEQKLEILQIKKEFDNIVPEISKYHSVFLFRINYAPRPKEFSFRKSTGEKLVLG